MNEKLLHQIALNRLPGIGNAAVKHLVSYLGSPEEIFQSNKSQLQRVPGIGSKLTQEILNKSSFHEAEEILKRCSEHSIAILAHTDARYPSQLKTIYDAPSILYFKGNLDNIEGRNVAIVGSRKATHYGRSITRTIVEDLESAKAGIISGLAYGIDIEAHRQAVKLGIPTYAILASGLDIIYPAQHARTADQMLERGGLFSENPPGTKPDARIFPARNRIIAGLSDATIIVEAASKGGALITANIANSYNKPVFAVPGNLGNVYSEGTNQLIAQQKALIYTKSRDLFYHLNWDQETPKAKEIASYELTPEERAILSVIEITPEGLSVDDIAWKTQIQINQLASSLLSLEFSGLVKLLPGKKYTITYQ